MAGKGRQKGDGRGRMGGRAKGTPNKVTSTIKETLAPLLHDYFSGDGLVSSDGERIIRLRDDLFEMAANERAKILTSIMPYMVPKLTSVEVKEKTEGKTFKDELDELENS